MAVNPITNATVLLGPYRISDKTNKVKVDYGAAMLAADVFGRDTKVNAPGLFEGGIMAEGYTDPATYDIDSLVFSAAPIYLGPTAARIPLTALVDDSDGALGYSIFGTLEKFETLGGIGELNPYTLSAKVGQGGTGQKSKVVRGTNLIFGAKSATGSGTPRQLGATLSTQRLFAALHVYSNTGGSLTMRLQSDNAIGFPSPVTVATFGALAAVTGFEWQEIAGPITDDYFRADWTFTGSSFAAYLLVGILTQR